MRWKDTGIKSFILSFVIFFGLATAAIYIEKAFESKSGLCPILENPYTMGYRHGKCSF